MDKSDTPTLLIPLLALLAIAFPFAMYRTPSSSGGINTQASQARKQEANPEVNDQGPKTQPHTAARLIEEFLQPHSAPAKWLDDDPRKDYSLDFMVATVADPIDSRLVRMFDSSIDSIERAFEADGYVLDRFDLAWSEPAGTKSNTSLSTTSGKGSKAKTKSKTEEEIPRYRRLPSLLLFRKPPDLEKEVADPKNDAYKGKLFLVFLVGETPTSGIHKGAMASALLQLASFFSWGPGHGALPVNLQGLTKKSLEKKLPIRIMGPSFSGSATSLEFTLRDWLAGPLGKDRSRIKFLIVSGSATSIHPEQFCKLHAGGPQTFQAVVPPDDVVMRVIFNYIGSLGNGRAYTRIAMLSEAGTAYGQAGQATIKRDQLEREALADANKRWAHQEPGIINLPFPLHISELRSASENQQQLQQNATPELNGKYNSSIHLNQGETSQPKETPPSFSDLGPASSELVLSRLLSTISHEEIHAVGILATDVRDVLFLAREIHQHCPGTLVFTVFSDLLFSHPDVTASTRGMIVFTPYPLYNLNQVWTFPYWGKVSRIQFRSQDAEGAYNATLALLDRKDLLLDYGEPFPSKTSGADDRERKPALWVTVVGRTGPLPVRTLYWPDRQKYSVRVKPEDFKGSDSKLPSYPSIDDDGICTSSSALGIILLVVILAGFSLWIISRYHRPARLESDDGSRWASRLLGEPVTPEYRPQARLFLFASLVCLLSADIVLTAVYFLPSLVGWSLQNGDSHWVISVLQFIGLFVLAGAVVVVLRAFWVRGSKNCLLQVAVKWVVVAGSFVAVGLSLILAGKWVLSTWLSPSPQEGVFTYIRAYEEFSGLSPLIPLVCIGLAGFLWGLCSFHRLRMIDGLRFASGEKTGDEYLLSMDTKSFNGVRDLENKVRGNLERASVVHTGWLAILAFVVLLLGSAVYLFLFHFVPSYGGLRFYFLFAWGFLLVYEALSTEFGRLCLAWAAFRHLLQRLALHPMREAYGRYRASFSGLPRIDLVAPLKAFSVLSFSVDQAERLLRMAPDLVSSDKLSEAHRQKLERWIPGAWLALWDANKHLSCALDANGKGKWRLAIKERSLSQRALGTLTQMTTELLEPSWRAPNNSPSLPMESEQFKGFRELAEEFLAGRVVLLISYVLPSLRKLGTFILIGLLLMLVAVMSYPFVQKNHFLAFNWVVILGFVALALVVIVQMERDVILSLLNGTTPGKVDVTRQFTFRILTYVMIPILALLSAQFPDTLGQVISWFGAVQGH